MVYSALTFLLLKGNILFLYRPQKDIHIPDPANIQTQQIKAYPVFRGGPVQGLSSQIILAIGKEPRGPHLWTVTGSIDLAVLPQKKNSHGNVNESGPGQGVSHLSLRYKMRMRFFIVRSANIETWKKFSGQGDYEPAWAKLQDEKMAQSRSQRFMYELPDVQGKFLVPLTSIPDSDLLLKWQQKANEVQRPLSLTENAVQGESLAAMISLFREMMSQRMTGHWYSTGLLMHFQGGAFNNKALHIFLGDYSYRNVSGKIFAVAPGKKTVHFLRLKNDKILLSRFAQSAQHPGPQNLKFALDQEQIQKLIDNLQKNSQDKDSPDQTITGMRNKLGDQQRVQLKKIEQGVFYVRVFQNRWLVDENGQSLWDSSKKIIPAQIAQNIKVPPGKGVLYLTSKDYFPISPQSENLVFFKVFVNKYEVGRTSPTIGSRKKEFSIALSPGRHLLRVERWELSGDEYVKSRKILQPRSLYITVHQGGITWAEVPYKPRKKVRINIKTQ